MIIDKAESLKGTLTVPGDKSISHRAVMLGSLSEGDTYIRGFLKRGWASILRKMKTASSSTEKVFTAFALRKSP